MRPSNIELFFADKLLNGETVTNRGLNEWANNPLDYISKWRKEGVIILDSWVENEETGKKYKIYWLERSKENVKRFKNSLGRKKRSRRL